MPLKAYCLWIIFCSKASHGQHWVYGPKITLKLLLHVLVMAPTIAQNLSSKSFKPNPPPPISQTPTQTFRENQYRFSISLSVFIM